MTDEGDGSAEESAAPARERPGPETEQRDSSDAPEDTTREGEPPSTSGDADRSAEGPPSGGTSDQESTGDPPIAGGDADGDAPPPSTPGDADSSSEASAAADPDSDEHGPGVPEDVRTYDRFTKIDGGTYERANEFLRDRTYITAREWAIARLCADFRTETGVEMTKIGAHLPELVPFMTDTYSPQAVNQARAAFEEKVRKSGATFLYGAMSDFFTAEELDDVMYEATEVAKFLLEVEGVDLSVDAELAAEEEISAVMREVREHSVALRHDEVTCPECGHQIRPSDD